MTNPLLSTREHLDRGRALRDRLPRRSLARLAVDRRRDPLGILEQQNATRVQQLIPLRVERMSASPFTFYRGTAAIMAADLASDEHTGIQVAACGDAHTSNFGFYASSHRRLVFDLNDFDESAWAPWEWDLKRLVASVVIAARASGRSGVVTEHAAITTTIAYARALRGYVTTMSPTDRFFLHFDAQETLKRLDKQSRRVLREAIADARRRTSERAARKQTELREDGGLRFAERPPAMIPAEPEVARNAREYVERYIRSARADVRLLMRGYSVVDVARRVVGVGSVGTRCSLVLLADGDGNHLVMQSKEANRSVLEQYGGIEQPRDLSDFIAEHGQGARVVALQRILQAVSDPFLGHLRTTNGHDLYVRQFHDMKGSIDMETLDDGPFARYAQACAVTLARAHAQSPGAAEIAGYAGGGRALGEALLQWGNAYADLSERDHRAFLAAHSAPTTPASDDASRTG